MKGRGKTERVKLRRIAEVQSKVESDKGGKPEKEREIVTANGEPINHETGSEEFCSR